MQVRWARCWCGGGGSGGGGGKMEQATGSSRSKHTRQVCTAIGTLLILAAIGVLFVHFNEGFTWIDSIYWAFVTLSSVGWWPIARAVDLPIFYVFFGVAATASALGTFARVWCEIEEEHRTNAFIARGVGEGMIREIDDRAMPMSTSGSSCRTCWSRWASWTELKRWKRCLAYSTLTARAPSIWTTCAGSRDSAGLSSGFGGGGRAAVATLLRQRWRLGSQAQDQDQQYHQPA